MTPAIWARGFLFAAFFLVSSCSFFSRQPPLPRRAAIEPTGSGEKFASLIEGADIIYFPSESVVLDSRSEAAWKLLEALRRTGGLFALGWDLVGREDEHRAFLAEAGKSGAEILPLRAPAQMETDETSPGFEPPPGDFERFARRFSTRDPSEARLRDAYEAALRAQQFAAAKISAHFREHRGEKILVFLRRDHLGPDRGVPYFVAQETKARQLILKPERHREPGLLTRN
ncbi:MAG: hypothetical protein QOE26_1528 [Verrucomicrobiota bacterium]